MRLAPYLPIRPSAFFLPDLCVAMAATPQCWPPQGPCLVTPVSRISPPHQGLFDWTQLGTETLPTLKSGEDSPAPRIFIPLPFHLVQGFSGGDLEVRHASTGANLERHWNRPTLLDLLNQNGRQNTPMSVCRAYSMGKVQMRKSILSQLRSLCVSADWAVEDRNVLTAAECMRWLRARFDNRT